MKDEAALIEEKFVVPAEAAAGLSVRLGVAHRARKLSVFPSA